MVIRAARTVQTLEADFTSIRCRVLELLGVCGRQRVPGLLTARRKFAEITDPRRPILVSRQVCMVRRAKAIEALSTLVRGYTFSAPQPTWPDSRR
jgi:hypothetical protein